MLELMQRFGIEAEVRLWPSNLEHGAEELLRKRFPKVLILKGEEAIATAFRLPARLQLRVRRLATRRPLASGNGQTVWRLRHLADLGQAQNH